MSSEIFYDKAFILVGEKYIPVVNHGSSNCFDFDKMCIRDRLISVSVIAFERLEFFRLHSV